MKKICPNEFNTLDLPDMLKNSGTFPFFTQIYRISYKYLNILNKFI